MKNLPLIFLGVFAALALSWGGLILGSQIQIGHLEPYVGPKGGVPGGETIRYPDASPKGGMASAGKDEYIKLGCIYCHSQQIRPAELFSDRRVADLNKDGSPQLDAHGKPVFHLEKTGDIARNWGPRHTVARDYITQDRVMLGTMRTGPDLANVGSRTAADWNYLHLFDPTITSPKSNMAPFAFLFKKVELKDGEKEPARALKLSDEYLAAHKLAKNIRFVPTERADNLVAYLMSLRIDTDLPESRIKE